LKIFQKNSKNNFTAQKDCAGVLQLCVIDQGKEPDLIAEIPRPEIGLDGIIDGNAPTTAGWAGL